MAMLPESWTPPLLAHIKGGDPQCKPFIWTPALEVEGPLCQNGPLSV